MDEIADLIRDGGADPVLGTGRSPSGAGGLRRALADQEHNSDLVDTLAAFLANDGHWRQTATQLHIHHNTLHYRLARVSSSDRAAYRDTGEPDRSGPGAGDPARAIATIVSISNTTLAANSAVT